MNINNLPHEVLFYIGTYFDQPLTQVNSLKTCRLWKQIFDDDYIWNQALRQYAQDYPHENKKDLLKIALKFDSFHQQTKKIAETINKLCQKQEAPLGKFGILTDILNLFLNRYNTIENKKIEELNKAAKLHDETFDLECDAFKLMLGPKLYQSIPDIRDLNPKDYSFLDIPDSESNLRRYLGVFRSEKHPVVKGTIFDLNRKVDKISFVILQYSLNYEEKSVQKGTLVFVVRKITQRIPCRLLIDAFSPNRFVPIYFSSINPFTASEIRQLIHKKSLKKLRPVSNDERWIKDDPAYKQISKTTELGMRWIDYPLELLPTFTTEKVCMTLGY